MVKYFIGLLVVILLTSCAGKPVLDGINVTTFINKSVGGTDNIDSNNDGIRDQSSQDKKNYGVATTFLFRFRR
jgi:hypothetical protein